MKAFRFASSLLIVCVLVPKVDASVLGNLLSFDGKVDFANDNSEGLFTDLTGDGVPDLVQGIVEIDQVNGHNVGATGGSIFAVYSFTLTPGSVPGIFNAVPTVGANSVNSLLNKGNALGANYANLKNYNTSVGEPGIEIIETNGVYTSANWTNTAAAGLPLALNFLPSPGNISQFMVDITAGFVPGSDDSHTIDIVNPAGPTGFYSGIYSIAQDIFGVNFAGIVSPPNDPFVGAPGGTGDLVTARGSITAPTLPGGNDPLSRGFNFADSGDYLINPLPEPLSLFVWTGLAAAGLVVRRRRITA